MKPPRQTDLVVARLWGTGLLVGAVMLSLGCQTTERANPSVQPRSSTLQSATLTTPQITSISIPVAISAGVLRSRAEHLVRQKLKAYSEDWEPRNVGPNGVVLLKAFEARELDVRSVQWKQGQLEFDGRVAGTYKASVAGVPFVGSFVGELRIEQALSITTNLTLRSDSRSIIDRLDFTALALPISKINWIKQGARDALLEELRAAIEAYDGEVNGWDWLRENSRERLDSLAAGVQVAREPEVWLQVRPSVLRVSQPRITKDKLVCYFGVDAVVTASLTKPAASTSLGELPVLIDASTPKSMVVNLGLRAGFPEWTALLRPRVVGFEQEVGLGTAVEIKDAELSGDGKAVAVKLQVRSRGRVNASANLTLIGIPRFDPVTQEVWLEGLDFDLQTKHLPVKLADLFLHDWLRKRVAEAARYSLAGELADYKRMANAEGRNREVFPGVVFNGKLNQLAVSDVRVQPQGVAIALLLSGKAGFVIQEISP